MELSKQTSQTDEKVKIIVRVRPTLKEEDPRDFVEILDVKFIILLKHPKFFIFFSNKR